MIDICGFVFTFIETKDTIIACEAEWLKNGLSDTIVNRVIYQQLKEHGFEDCDETDIVDILVVIITSDFDMVYSPRIVDIFSHDFDNDYEYFKVTKKGGAKKRNG